MKRIIDILNQKWATVLAFIPGINALYLLFRFFAVMDKCYSIPFGELVITVLPSCLFYLVVPSSWNWLITHLIFSEVAFIFIRNSRGGYLPKLHLNRDKIELVCVILVAIFFIWNVPKIHDANVVSRNSKNAVAAIIYEDEETWRGLIHPLYGTDLLDLHAVKNDMQKKGVILPDDYFYGSRRLVDILNVEDGKAMKMEQVIKTNDKNYRFIVVYQESENGSGFTQFEITKMGKN